MSLAGTLPESLPGSGGKPLPETLAEASGETLPRSGTKTLPEA